MVPAVVLTQARSYWGPTGIRPVSQKEAACWWEGRGMTAKDGLEEGKSTEWAKGQRAATKGHPGEEEKDCEIQRSKN